MTLSQIIYFIYYVVIFALKTSNIFDIQIVIRSWHSISNIVEEKKNKRKKNLTL